MTGTTRTEYVYLTRLESAILNKPMLTVREVDVETGEEVAK